MNNYYYSKTRKYEQIYNNCENFAIIKKYE